MRPAKSVCPRVRQGADMRMDMILTCILIYLQYYTCEASSGYAFTTYVTSRKAAIERYITSGNDDGRRNCDILNASPITSNLILDTPQFVMDMKTLKTFDAKTALSNANCLVVVAQVNDAGTLSYLIKFGIRVTEDRKSLGMVLGLGSNLTLESLNFDNETLPFVIAAHLNDSGGREQILCPEIGNYKPHIRSYMCHESEKTLSGYTGWSIWSWTTFC